MGKDKAPVPNELHAYFINVPKKIEFKDSVVLFCFSLNHEHHTGESLKAILALAKSLNIKTKNLIFLLADKPLAYSLAAMDLTLDPNSQAALDNVDEEVNRWLKENKEALQGVIIRRWSEFSNDPEFQKRKQKIFKVYHNTTPVGQKFKLGIDKTVKSVFLNQDIFPDPNRAKELCTSCALEESAVLAYLAQKLQINFFAHPTIMPTSIEVTKQLIVRKNHFLNCLQFRIKLFKDLSPHDPNDEKSYNEITLARNKKYIDTHFQKDMAESGDIVKTLGKLLKESMYAMVDDLIATGRLKPEKREKFLQKLAKSLAKDSAKLMKAPFPNPKLNAEVAFTS
jgi:hypothetical protein